MITTIQIIVIAFAYVSLLFLIAYTNDKNKPKVIPPRRKALVYSFSLAIYCTSWTFYGAVGSAAKTGWGYLPIYLGPILLYTVGWPLLKRFVRVGHEQNTTSISDFIASRYGKSQTIAAIVTVIAVLAIIPYISLQLKAITMSIGVFDAQQNLFNDHHVNSMYITFLLIVFSILFGTRNIDVTEHQYGMMNAIAFESIVKLVAFCSVGLFALFSIYDGPTDLINVIASDSQLKSLWFSGINLENFITQTILAFIAILCLPRQFHVSVVEYHQSADLKCSRWVFPGYLVLISVFVIPIVVAGSQYFSGQNINADTYILALPLAENQSALTTIVFIGGLSAATGMVIVATVALSTMISNDLILPVILHKAKSQHLKDKQFNQRMLLVRRIAIIACLLMSYIFYRLFDNSQSLASIGYLSFTAVLQFFPALMLGLFWNRATKVGAIIGMLLGFLCWCVLTLVPSIQGDNLLSNESSYTGLSILTESLFISLSVNSLAIFLFSIITKQSLTEKVQAYAYTRAMFKDDEKVDSINHEAKIFVKDLKSLAAAIVGTERMIAAFESLTKSYGDDDVADENLVNFTENILSSSIGSSSARALIISAFKEKGINIKEIINLLSSTSQALQFNRRLTEITMDNISQGVSVSDTDKNIVAWNSSYERLMNYPKGFLQIGKPIAELIAFNAKKGFCGPGEIQSHIEKRLAHLESGLSYRFERVRSDGIVLDIVGNPLPHGGYVTTYNDISEYKKIESALKENERKVALYTDNSPAQLAYVNTQLIFLFANKAFSSSMHKEKSQIVGQHIAKVLPAEELAFKLPYINLALQNRQQHFEFEKTDDSSQYFLVTYIPDLTSEGKVDGVYTISQNISNRRKAELALKEINVTLEERVEMRTDELHMTVNALEVAKAEAEKANQSKSRFLAAASHDLLQPFNAARLFAEMLKSEAKSMTVTQAELVEKADQSLSVAENIIRSLVDISKLDSGTIYPNISTFDIYDLVASLAQQFSGFAEKKDLQFKVHNRHQLIKSDRDMLYRVLQNFISNAIRYTHTGSVLLSVQSRKNAENDRVRISVWDTGIGIRDKDQQEIFKEFNQLSDPNHEMTESGLGLGLSISERLAAILDHPISISSRYGLGTVFSLHVPCSNESSTILKHDKTNQSQIKTDIIADTKVLCVDNEIQITDAMSLLIGRWGGITKTAQAEEHIDDVLSDGFIPEILIVDYQLDRGKTGVQFIHELRNRVGINIPAVIVTADHTLEVEDEIMNAGLKLLYKPVKPAMLRATMNALLR